MVACTLAENICPLVIHTYRTSASSVQEALAVDAPRPLRSPSKDIIIFLQLLMLLRFSIDSITDQRFLLLLLEDMI